MSIARRLAQAELRLSRRATQAPVTLDPVELFTRAVGEPPDPWQQDVLRSDAPRLLLLCSRQSGKTATVAVIALQTALQTAGALVLIFSPSWRQSSEMLRRVAEFHDAVSVAPANLTSATRLEFPNKSRVISLPSAPRTTRGYPAPDLVIFDEGAHVTDDVYTAARPMLATGKGRLVALSSAWAMLGWFYRAWSEEAEWTKTKITADSCPRISPEFLLEERRVLGPVLFRCEYYCEFLSEVDGLFSYDAIMGAMVNDRPPLFGV